MILIDLLILVEEETKFLFFGNFQTLGCHGKLFFLYREQLILHGKCLRNGVRKAVCVLFSKQVNLVRHKFINSYFYIILHKKHFFYSSAIYFQILVQFLEEFILQNPIYSRFFKKNVKKRRRKNVAIRGSFAIFLYTFMYLCNGPRNVRHEKNI